MRRVPSRNFDISHAWEQVQKQEQKGRCKGHLEYVLNTNAFELFITPITVTTTAMATTVYPLLRSLNQVVIVPACLQEEFCSAIDAPRW